MSQEIQDNWKILPIDLSGQGGLSQYPSENIRDDYMVPKGQVLNGTYNPFIRAGYMSPPSGTSTSLTLNQTQNANFRSTLYDALNDTLYIAEDGQQIFKGTSSTATSFTRVSNISTAGIRDMELYSINGVQTMFVMYTTSVVGGGNAEIAICTLPYTSASDNKTWLSATVSGAFTMALTNDFFMVVADNSYAYLFMDNHVHKIDGTVLTGGTNGTITQDVLIFPANFNLVDALDYGGSMFICLHQYTRDIRKTNPGFYTEANVNVGVYIWDRQSTVVGTVSYIPIPGFVSIQRIFITSSGSIRILAVDSIGYTQLLEYTGSFFRTIYRLNFTAFPVFRDAVSNFGQMTMWQAQDGNLYVYGPLSSGDISLDTQLSSGTERLFSLYSPSASTTNGGVIIPIAGTSGRPPAVYFTYQLGIGPTLTNVRLSIFTVIGQTGGTSVVAIPPITFPLIKLPVYSKTDYLKIECVPTTSSGATVIATVNVYINQNSNPFNSVNITQLMASTGIIDIPCTKVGVRGIQVEIVYPNGASIGTNDFAPSSAYLTYAPIIKRS